MNTYDRKIRRLTITGLVTLFAITILLVYLMPFGYMLMTSVKDKTQIVRNTILPLTQEKYEYKGEELPGYRIEPSSSKAYDVYQVPINEEIKTLVLIKEAIEESPNIFMGPSNFQFFEWEGDITTLERAQQVSLYKSAQGNPEYGLAPNSELPLYEVEIDGETQELALVQSPEYLFVDARNPDSGVFEFEWSGDISELERPQQIVLYEYEGQTNPENNLERNKKYPLYEVTLDNDTQEEWAILKGPAHLFIDITRPEAGVFEWDGELKTLEETEDRYIHAGVLNREAGMEPDPTLTYPVYNSPPGEDGIQVQWALIRAGTGTEESLFINTSQDDELVRAVFDERFTPVGEDATILYRPKYSEQIYGLTFLKNYDVYMVPTDEGEQEWALIRRGTGTEESILVKEGEDLTGFGSRTEEYISASVELENPVLGPGVYYHNTERLPRWSVLKGDKLPLFFAPISDYGEQWALVSAGTPGRTPTYYYAPSNPEVGVFDYSEQWVGSLEKVDYVDFQWGNYSEAWETINFPRLLFNTMAIALIGLVGTLASCTLVAYGFARFPIPYKNVIFMVLIATIVLPRQVTLVPTFAFFSRIGWTGTWLPLIVPHFFANAYNVFLLRQFFQTIPREMDEAAMIDGAGPFRILRTILLPQAYPALVAAGLFHIVFAWNDYFEPLIYLLGEKDLQPISVGVQQFNFVFGQEPQLIQAAALIAMIFPLLVFMFAQRFFMQGIVITGVDK